VSLAIAAVLLAAGTALQLLACAGAAIMRDAYDRLHYAGLSVPAAVLVGAAVLVREGPSQIGNRAILVVVTIAVTSPVLTHVTARAGRVRERGDWRSGDEEMEVLER
jgi:monovalent cation/proton antiporter MnhG/PhaG subunit